LGWSLSASAHKCGSNIHLNKTSRTCSLGDRKKKARPSVMTPADSASAPAPDPKEQLTQLALTERGVWRGKHTFSVKVFVLLLSVCESLVSNN
jgi:hypothetical protein